MQLPDGFTARATGPGLVLVCRADRIDAALAAGLGRVATWRQRVASPRSAGAGRGLAGRASLGVGPALHLKKLRRGGLLAALRSDRFRGTRRIVANLVVAQEARSRGVATAAPVAALIHARGLGFHEGWLAFEEIADAASLHARFSADAASGAEVRAALLAVRGMHDRGVVHRDLNLGNVLVRGSGSGCEAFVIDLDRASIVDAPLSIHARRAALRRLERSYEKWFGHDPRVADAWYRLYAEGRADLGELVTRGRRAGRAKLAFHRLGWKLTSRASR